VSIVLGTGLLYPAFRIAGVTKRPMRVPSPDQSQEAIGIINRMLGSWDIDPLEIYASTIATYNLVADQLSYTIGPSGNFNVTPTPTEITLANIILPGTPPIRRELHITDKEGWGALDLQLIPGGIPTTLYPDYTFPLATLYLYPQAPAGYQIELYTPQLLPVFAAVTDSVVLPQGYEHAIVQNLAVLLSQQFRSQADMDPDVPRIAGLALAAIESRNAPVPRMTNDAARLNSGRGAGNWNWWRTGGF
jgi:hypothetical protein